MFAARRFTGACSRRSERYRKNLGSPVFSRRCVPRECVSTIAGRAGVVAKWLRALPALDARDVSSSTPGCVAVCESERSTRATCEAQDIFLFKLRVADALVCARTESTVETYADALEQTSCRWPQLFAEAKANGLNALNFHTGGPPCEQCETKDEPLCVRLRVRMCVLAQRERTCPDCSRVPSRRERTPRRRAIRNAGNFVVRVLERARSDATRRLRLLGQRQRDALPRARARRGSLRALALRSVQPQCRLRILVGV